MEKNVTVVDEQGHVYGATYPKRAKGLVKNGRARFVDENTICLACPPNQILEDTEMSENMSEEELNDEDYLAEGLYIREKVETKEGWTFSDAVWYALFNEQTGVWEFFVVENNVKANEAKAEMTFTNSYNAKNPTTNTNTTSPNKESPKTGDNNVLGLLVAVMLVSGCGAVAMYVYNKKRRYF